MSQPGSRRRVEGSLQRLGLQRLDALLLHRSADLLGSHGPALCRALDALEASGTCRSVGISINEPADLEALWDVWRPRIVQSPCNVLDRRLIHSGWLERCERAGVRMHARSVFLQGACC